MDLDLITCNVGELCTVHRNGFPGGATIAIDNGTFTGTNVDWGTGTDRNLDGDEISLVQAGQTYDREDVVSDSCNDTNGGSCQ